MNTGRGERNITLSKLVSERILLIPCTNCELRANALFCWKSATKPSINFLDKTWPDSQLVHLKGTFASIFTIIFTSWGIDRNIDGENCLYIPVELIWIIGKKEKQITIREVRVKTHRCTESPQYRWYWTLRNIIEYKLFFCLLIRKMDRWNISTLII